MGSALSEHEEKILRNQFPKCSQPEVGIDVVFAYSENFTDNAELTLKLLQQIVDYQKEATSLNPTAYFKTRTIVGYTDQSSQPNWSGARGNRVHIPDKSKWYDQSKLLHTCTHELVHPFYRVSPLHASNEKWGDPFCDFLRGPLKHLIGQDGVTWWQNSILMYEKGENAFCNVVGQFLLCAKKKYYEQSDLQSFIKEFISDKAKIKDFIRYLFNEFSSKSLCEVFIPVNKMKI